MINRIIDFSVEHRFVVFLLVAAACITGWWSMERVALDAVPDLNDTQVIIYSRWDRSPDIIEDQVTYPIVSAMLGAPKVKNGARVFRFWLLICVCHFRGGYRHLLGAFTDPGVSCQRPSRSAGWCQN